VSKEEPVRKKTTDKHLYSIDDIVPSNPIDLFFNRLLAPSEKDEPSTVPKNGTASVPEIGTPNKKPVPKIGTPPSSTVPKTGTSDDKGVPETGTVPKTGTVPEIGTVPNNGTPKPASVPKNGTPQESIVPEIGTPTVPDIGTVDLPVPEIGTHIYGTPLNPEHIPDLILFAHHFLKNFSHTALSLLSYLLCKQKQTVLSFSYRQLMKEINYSKTTIANTMYTFKNSDFFIVTIPPGSNAYLDIQNFVEAFKKHVGIDPVLDTVPENGTVPSSSSSSLLLNKTTTTKRGVPENGTEGNRFINKLRLIESDINIYIFSGVAKSFGLKETDLSKNICEIVFKNIEDGKIEQALRNIVYAVKNVKSQNRGGFFYSSLKNNYGSSLTKGYTDQISERIECLKRLKEEGPEGPALKELKQFAKELGICQGIEGMPRKELEEEVKYYMKEIDKIHGTIKSYLKELTNH
jgi:hypothetical protein